MKKILLGTSALIGAAALFAGAANAAQTPKITLGGFSTFQGGVETGNDLKTTGTRSGAFRSENTVTVRVDGKSGTGLGYGAGIDISADTSVSSVSAGINSERTFVYVDGKWGKIQGGSDLGVTNTMKVDASSIARASGGIDGDWFEFATANALVLATPDLILDYGAGNFGDESLQNMNKISYYTPRFSGLQAGVSYLPDTVSRGQVIARTGGDARNVVLGALSYEYQCKKTGIGLSLGATGEYGSARLSTNNDLRTYQVGGKIDYMGFSVAGSYANLGDSLRVKAVTNDSSNYFWTVGAAYETGPFGASVTYIDSNRDAGATNNDFSNISVGVDYKLAAGFTPYAEVSFVDNNPTGNTNDNKSTVFIAGTQLAF